MNMSNISNDSISKLFGLDDYGYGDAAPDTRRVASPTITHHHKAKRRSSMKKSDQPRRSSIQYRDVVEYVIPGNRKIRRRSSIGFDNAVTVRCLPPIESEVESLEDLWFHEEDYDKMKERSFTLVDLVQRYGPSCGFDGSKKPCIRGLEGLISADEKITNQSKACNSVLRLQAEQRSNGIFDDHALAESYMMNTIGSRREAAKLAKQDEKIARSSARRSSCRCVSP